MVVTDVDLMSLLGAENLLEGLDGVQRNAVALGKIIVDADGDVGEGEPVLMVCCGLDKAV